MERKNKKEGCKRQAICKDYEKKECIHRGKDWFKPLRNSILLSTLTLFNTDKETWKWYRAQQAKFHAMEICYLSV